MAERPEPVPEEVAGVVYLKTGRAAVRAAILRRSPAELALETDAGPVFRVPLAEVERVEFPWHLFGGGMRVTVRSERHTLAFAPPARVEGGPSRFLKPYEEIVGRALQARRTSREWQAALEGVGQG